MQHQAESFASFLEQFGKANPPQLRFQEGDDYQSWKKQFLAAMEHLRGPLPDRVPLAVEELESTQEDTHRRTLLRIRVSAFSSLMAYLLVPLDIQPGEQRPGLLVSHGHTEFGVDSVCGVRGLDLPEGRERAYALSAVNDGYVVLAPAWWGWAGRDGHWQELKCGNRDKCNVIQMAASMYGLSVLSLHIQDGQAAVDVLSQRPEVDSAHIGCIGNSYGGRTTMWITIYDQRIRVCVPSGCMNTFRERSLKLSSCGIQYLPGILRLGDIHELFCLIAPRPMQLQGGEKDPLLNDTDRDAILASVRRAYQAAAASDNLEAHIHPGGHILKWDAAREFLGRHLGRP